LGEWWERFKQKFVFTMPCTNLCGKPLKRFHMTCLWCRLQRIRYGRLNPESYYKLGSVIFKPCLNVPVNHKIYVLFIDTYRPFYAIKDKFLQILLKIAEALAHTEGHKETYKVSELVLLKGLIVPRRHTIYGLYIDNSRRFPIVKSQLLKRVLTVAEGLSN